MATTTNYGWTTPDDTALVKDGAFAIRSLGSSIDTTLKAQIDAQIPDSIIDAKGDLISATAADTPARLAVGTNGQVLTADSSTSTGLKWATVSASPANDSATVSTNESTTSTTYTDLATSGPAVTLTTGTKALVIITATLDPISSVRGLCASFAVSGATTITASDTRAVAMYVGTATAENKAQRMSAASRLSTLTAGSNTFTMKYRATVGATVQFSDREILVIDLGS